MKVMVLAKYSAAAYAGLMKNPDDDRRAAIASMMEKSGGKMLDLQFLRGEYDICVIGEIGSFEDMAAIKMLIMSSGSLDEMKVMEVVDLNVIASKAAAIAGNYRAPGS
mgnify:FL=1